MFYETTTFENTLYLFFFINPSNSASFLLASSYAYPVYSPLTTHPYIANPVPFLS
jgi:hypothetical protein